MAAALWKGEEASSRKPLTSCPASSSRALVSSSRDPASKGMSAWWFPVFGELCVVWALSTSMNLGATIWLLLWRRQQGLGVENGGALRCINPWGRRWGGGETQWGTELPKRREEPCSFKGHIEFLVLAEA